MSSEGFSDYHRMVATHLIFWIKIKGTWKFSVIFQAYFFWAETISANLQWSFCQYVWPHLKIKIVKILFQLQKIRDF